MHQKSATKPIMNSTGLSIKLAVSSVVALTIILAGSAQGQSGNPPSITTQPTNQTVTAALTATFSVKANGTSPLNYQWQLNGANLAGATGSAMSIADAQAANADYRTRRHELCLSASDRWNGVGCFPGH